MGAESTPDPESPRVRFGAEMRRLRREARWSQAAVGARLGCTQTQVSRLELASRTPSQSDAERLDQMFGLTKKQHFTLLYKRIFSHTGGPSWFLGWVDEIEPAAKVIRSWDPLLIPGLLQTEEYARCVFAQSPRITEEEVEARVRARLRRQRIFDRSDPPYLLVLIDEGVLRRRVGGPEVMRDQLDRLLAAAKLPNVCIQVVDPGCLAGMPGTFMIAEMPEGEPDASYTDSAAEGRISTNRDILASLSNRYEAIRRWAYPEHVSLRMIQEVREEWT
ncbi:helix-turn-helix domain-containing protein [Spongiactinospora gelatinilytica]|nr:helix-turn-helix transcriptional regulator [Spongiactinospora gelatinilytica]